MKSNFGQISLEIITDEDRLSADFNVLWSIFEMIGGVTKEALLSRLSIVVGTESCSEQDDLSCRGVFDRCRRLAK